MRIVYLKNTEIDKIKWDECITSSENRIIYALSWYLDIVSPGWDALIMDDYTMVMPLTWKSKLRLKYIYKPLFIQQLGIFGKEPATNVVDQFLSHLPLQFRLADIQLNELNIPGNKIFKTSINTNYKINIGESYQKIQEKYNRNCNRNIKKAQQAGCSFASNINNDDFFELLINQIKLQTKKFGINDVSQFKNFINQIINKQKGELVGIKDNAGNLVAAGFYLFSFDSLIFLICGSTSFGKENQTMYLLVDEQIKRYAGKFQWYDFSGSNIKGIAYFNSTFGAEPKTYYSVKINRLSLPMKLLTGKF